jgi:hypothetical protein
MAQPSVAGEAENSQELDHVNFSADRRAVSGHGYDKPDSKVCALLTGAVYALRTSPP